MAVGVLSRSSSQSDIPTMTRRRRNGMAYIFHGQSVEDISYLKDCFSKRLESTSSESDFETDDEVDVEMLALGEAFHGIDVDTTHSDVSSDEVMESDGTDSEADRVPVPAKRRVALADIFEGVPEYEVSDFLAEYSSTDSTPEAGLDNEGYRHVAKTRRYAKSDIFEGVPMDKVDELRDMFQNIDNDIDTTGLRSPNHSYLFKRRGALPDIYHGVVDDELKARLMEYSSDEESSSSDGSESPAESDDSGVQTNGSSSDSSLPDESYLWRRRFALANIFEDVNVVGPAMTHARAQ